MVYKACIGPIMLIRARKRGPPTLVTFRS